MNTELRLHRRVLEARQLLIEGREKLRRQHNSGSPGIQLGSYLTDLQDGVVLGIFEAALADLADEQLNNNLTLVAHGGYGRRDAAPFSDVDVMLLHHPRVKSRIPEVAGRLVKDLTDTGLEAGFSVRTPRQAWQLARRDPVIITSLAESRLLGGDAGLFQRFFDHFGHRVAIPSRKLIRAIEKSRLEERHKYGETVYLLEPNVKRSRGALRDIHFLRWIGFVRYGESDPANLKQMGLLTAQDQARIRDAHEFLLRLRNDLHFHAGHPQDMLTKPEQLRIADAFGYVGDEGVLAVERFMQDYFHHTTNVRNIVGNFLAAAKWGSPIRMTLHNLVGQTVYDDYVVGPRYVSARPSGVERVRGDLVEVLRLMDISNRFNKRIDHDLWQVIRDSMDDTVQISGEAALLFLSILSQPARLGRLLRRLHEVRVLEKLVPGFDHARCLLQFNDYHKYTVDEHSFRAVERATEFESDPGLLGKVYKSIRDKTTLHLALLIHDIGKGYPEDHSEVGRRIAVKVAKHLHMSSRESERLEFLVHRHLMLNHLAFRRDNSDQSILLEAASEIGSPANLRMLFVLTCADLAAVGPGVLNQWKLEVLGDLYQRVLETLSADSDDLEDAPQSAQRAKLLEAANASEKHGEWLRKQVEVLPLAYVRGASPHQVVEDLLRFADLPPGESVSWGTYLPDRDVSSYSIAARDDIAKGIFHRLTGAITSQGLQILSAEIHSLADSMFLDRFYVIDPDYNGEPPPNRFEEVTHALASSLRGEFHEAPTFRTVWSTQRDSRSLAPLPTQVKIDNATSDYFTIIDVFANDRPGLLYAITKALYELGLSVQAAKIGTYIDQVVDVFYITDQDGRKIEAEVRLGEIQSRIYHAIEAWDRGEVATP